MIGIKSRTRPAPRALWQPVGAAALCALAIELYAVMTTHFGAWFQGLQKPSWQPPDALFAPAWTFILALSATAGILYWRRAAEVARAVRLQVMAAFAMNAFLNTFWSLLFFRLQRPDLALYEVGFLWASILLLIVLVARTTRVGAALLTPYLAGVTFVAWLNLAIVQLNPHLPVGG